MANTKKTKKKRLTTGKYEELDVGLAVGASYGKRTSKEVRITYPTNSGKRTATFYLFPLDFIAHEIVREYGGNIAWQPTSFKPDFAEGFKENTAFLMGCLDFDRGAWSGFERENNREIVFPKEGTDEEKIESVKFLAGLFAYVNSLRAAATSMAINLEEEYEEAEGNSGNGSETAAEPGTKSKPNRSK